MQTQQAPPPPPAAGEQAPCPSCKRPVERTQPFCLHCGRRIARDYRRPPNWRIPIALTALLVVAAGVAAGFGITELTEQDEGPDTITYRTGPHGQTLPDPVEGTTTTPPPAAQPPAAAPPPAGQPPADPAGKPTPWPAGEDAYTVVLLTTKDRAAADRAARKAAAAGERAGVLESGKYARFDPGLFVAFAGQFETVEAASKEARRLAGEFPGAYARYIEPE